jgi:hypothetical protein
MTGAGKVIDSRITGLLESERVSPVVVCFRPFRDAGALLTLVRVHLEDLADPLLAVLGRVQDRRTGLEATRVDPDVGQLAEVLVGLDLERQRGERLVRVGVPEHLGLAVQRGAGDRRHVQRAGQEVDDRIEHRLDALVLERGAEQDRREVLRDGAAPDAGLDVLDTQLLAGEVSLEDLVVALGEGLQQGGPPGLRLLEEVGRDLDGLVRRALVLGGPAQALHLHQVDDADEVGLDAPGQLQDQRGRVQPVADHVHGPEEVGPGAVHLVHEAHPRDAVLVGLPPHLLGLRLHAGDRVEHGDGAVENPQRPLHLDGEVDVPGGVDDVDGVVTPRGLRRGGRDRDAALLLLRHPVHRRRAVVDLADLVVDPGVIQDPLGRRGLARVDVGHDPDVAGHSQVRVGGSHCNLSSRRHLVSYRTPRCGTPSYQR